MPDNISKYNETRDSEEHSLTSREGGIKSGEVRRQNRILRGDLEEVLENPELVRGVTEALINKALKGDVRAYEVIRDTIGEAPKLDKFQLYSDDMEFKIVINEDDSF